MNKLFGIIGAGGFGREVMPLVVSQTFEFADFAFVVEDQYLTQTREINGRRLMGLSEFLAADADKFFNVAIGDGKTRERIANLIKPEVAKTFEIRPDSLWEGDANQIGPGAIFCANTMVTSNAKIGRFFQCNIYSYVAHDCVIGDFVTFAPGVKCNGHVVIEDYAYIGAGAIIRDGTKSPIVIGKGAVVGMGAVVTKSVPPGAVVVGNPAKELLPKS